METKPIYCKKLVFNDLEYPEPKVLFGLIIEKDDFFITFRTEVREYTISMRQVVSISDSDKIFRGVAK